MHPKLNDYFLSQNMSQNQSLIFSPTNNLNEKLKDMVNQFERKNFPSSQFNFLSQHTLSAYDTNSVQYNEKCKALEKKNQV